MYPMRLLLGLNEIAIIKQLAPHRGTSQLNSTVVRDWTVSQNSRDLSLFGAYILEEADGNNK